MSVSPFDDGTRNISGLARIFKRDRRTISTLIQAHDVQPAGRAGGRVTYAIGEIAAVLFSTPTTEGTGDEKEADPKARLAHWRAENEKLKHQLQTGQLLHREDVRRDISVRLLQPVVNMLETLPERVEQHAGLTPEQAAALVEAVDRERARLYREICDLTEPPDGEEPNDETP